MLTASSRGKTASRVARAVTGDDDRDLFRRQAALAGFASPLARRSGKVFALALERFQNECLVRFDDARQRGRFVLVESGKKSVTPAKRSRTIYSTTLSRRYDGFSAPAILKVRNFGIRESAKV
jgi:hypothetical protein